MDSLSFFVIFFGAIAIGVSAFVYIQVNKFLKQRKDEEEIHNLNNVEPKPVEQPTATKPTKTLGEIELKVCK